MDRESFLESVKRQYADDIRAAFLECEHHNGRLIDIKALNHRLAKLQSGAKVDGLGPKDFHLLVQATLPEVFEKISLPTSDRKAA